MLFEHIGRKDQVKLLDFGLAKELPEVDRRRLAPILDEEPPDREGYDVGVGYGTVEEMGNASVFVPDPEYDVLVYEGDRYRIDVESRTATETEYRYEVTDVATDVASYADQIRSTYLFELTGLSDAEREVVEEAIDGAYFEDDEAFRTLLREARDAGEPNDAGIEEGDRVGTFCWNHHRHFETYFGVPNAGAQLHTINPLLPDEHVQYIVENAQDRTIFVDQSFLPKLAGAVADDPDPFECVCNVVQITGSARGARCRRGVRVVRGRERGRPRRSHRG